MKKFATTFLLLLFILYAKSQTNPCGRYWCWVEERQYNENPNYILVNACYGWLDVIYGWTTQTYVGTYFIDSVDCIFTTLGNVYGEFYFTDSVFNTNWCSGRLLPNDSIQICTGNYITQHLIYYFGHKILTYPMVGLDEKSLDEKITILPNPATNRLRIGINDINTSLQLQLLNLQGNIQLQTSMSESKVLDVSPLPRGVYILNIKTKDFEINKKIILI